MVNRTVAILDLSGNMIGGRPEIVIASQLGLRGNGHKNVDDDALQKGSDCAGTAFGYALRLNQSLTKLDLSWNQMSVVTGIELGNALDLMMAPAEVESLQATLTCDFDKIMGYIADIDASQAEATNPDDKAMIFCLIEDRPGGFQQFNADVIAALRRWLLDTAIGRLRELEGGGALECRRHA